jgi:hypothetical protein
VCLVNPFFFLNKIKNNNKKKIDGYKIEKSFEFFYQGKVKEKKMLKSN